MNDDGIELEAMFLCRRIVQNEKLAVVEARQISTVLHVNAVPWIQSEHDEAIMVAMFVRVTRSVSIEIVCLLERGLSDIELWRLPDTVEAPRDFRFQVNNPYSLRGCEFPVFGAYKLEIWAGSKRLGRLRFYVTEP